MNKKHTSRVQRKNHNEDLIERMKKGDPLQTQSALDSWFPPRPVVKKNTSLLKQLHSGSEKNETKKKIDSTPISVSKVRLKDVSDVKTT